VGQARGPVLQWTARLMKSTATELPGIYMEMQALPDVAEQQRMLPLLCARWAELDAPGGLAFFTQAKKEHKDSWGRIWLLTEWALRDPAAAYDAVMELPEKEAQGELLNVGTELMRENPEKFWAWFQKARKPLPGGWNDSDNWRKVAADHLEELLAMAGELAAAKPDGPEPPGRRSELNGLYKLLAATMAGKDVSQALNWAKQQPEAVRNSALQGALGVVARETPEKIADSISLLKSEQIGANFFNGSGAGELIGVAMGKLTERDPVAAVEWLRANIAKLGDDSHEALQKLQEGLASAMRDGKLTPQQAFNAVRAAKEENEYIRLNVLRQMWKGLPADQLAATAEWLKGVDSKSARGYAMRGILPEWMALDQEAALKFASELKDPGLAKEMFAGLVSNASNGLVSTQSERMAAALQMVPPEHRAQVLYDQVRMNYSDGMMDHSPPFQGALMAAALEGLPPGETTDRAFIKVAETWGANDPQAALAWAGQQTDPGLREKATGAAVAAWAREDAWGTSEWIDALPAGELRDNSSHHLARALRTEEPESAWTWAGSIGDPATRLEAQAAVLRKWRDSSAPDAQAAVEAIAAGLPPADRQRLVDTLQGRDNAK
jgi:hypothetical protein